MTQNFFSPYINTIVPQKSEMAPNLYSKNIEIGILQRSEVTQNFHPLYTDTETTNQLEMAQNLYSSYIEIKLTKRL